MKINPITLIIFASALYPIIRGAVFGFSSLNVKRDVAGIAGSIAFIVAMYIGIKYIRNFISVGQNGNLNNAVSFLPNSIAQIINNKPIISYSIILILIIYILYKIISIIFMAIINITVYQLIDVAENFMRNKSFTFRRVVGALIEVPRAFCYLIVVILFLNIASIFSNNQQLNNYLSNSKTYSYICSKFVSPITNSNVAKKIPQIVGNSIKIVVKQPNSNGTSDSIGNIGNSVVYYNGVTLDDAVKSNDTIDSFSRNLIKGQTTTLDKADKLYNWEGSNISYDYNKANEVLNDNYNVKSGAIPTFNTKTGICFDFASLYVAMCRADNIKVRLVTGEGFNGVSWVSHAWNMVYIPEVGKWINVDTTFASGGNYFNNPNFDLDHRNAKIIGEW
ncbi:MAG: transglutaminase-like domain-containing protein [Clostridium sp.]|nr:transglutaminase-like domain-containing protein [Clostridium sp.]